METMVRQSLDFAIARVGKEEYRRLSDGKSPTECLNCVTEALESLRKLQAGESPQYDNEWVALFYLTWYQPRQVNLALAIVRPFFFRDNPLNVIDVGCGAFAVQIALTIANAEKRTKTQITVQGIDPNKPMRTIGEKVWLKFRSIVCKNTRLKSLADACNAIAYHSCCSYLRPVYLPLEVHIGWTDPSAECWLTAVHASYESNKTALKKALADIRSESARAPALEIVTTDQSKWRVARSVAGERFKEMSRPLPWLGCLCKTTAWRRSLIDQLQLPKQSSGDIVRGYLKPSVQWNPPTNTPVVLFRKDG